MSNVNLDSAYATITGFAGHVQRKVENTSNKAMDKIASQAGTAAVTAVAVTALAGAAPLAVVATSTAILVGSFTYLTVNNNENSGVLEGAAEFGQRGADFFRNVGNRVVGNEQATTTKSVVLEIFKAFKSIHNFFVS